MNIKATKFDIIWNYVGTAFSLLSSFLLLPFAMLKLTGSEIGLWYVFLAVNGLMTLFDFGFDPTFARNVAYVWSGAVKLKKQGAEFSKGSSKVNYELFSQLIETAKKVYGIIALVVFAFVLFIGTPYILHVSASIKDTSHVIAWVIFTIGLLLNMYMGYFSALLRGVGAVAIINKATIFSRLSQFICSLILLFLNFKLIAVSIGFLVNGLVLRYLCRFGLYNYHGIGSKISPYRKTRDKQAIGELFKIVSYNAFRDGLVSVSNYLTTQASSLIASAFLSLTQTGIYSISLQFANAVSTVAASMISAYHPTMQSAYVNGDTETEKSVVAKGLSMLYVLTLVGTVGVIFVVFPVLKIFKNGMNFSIPVFIGLSIYTFLWQQQSASAAYISNTNRVPYAVPFVVSSVLGVVLTIAAMKFSSLGIWSLIVCPAVVQLSFNNWFWTLVVMRRLRTTLFRTLMAGFRFWGSQVKKVLPF